VYIKRSINQEGSNPTLQ